MQIRCIFVLLVLLVTTMVGSVRQPSINVSTVQCWGQTFFYNYKLILKKGIQHKLSVRSVTFHFHLQFAPIFDESSLSFSQKFGLEKLVQVDILFEEFVSDLTKPFVRKLLVG